MNKVYIAGSLFKESDIVQRKLEEAKIKELANQFKIYNPITADANDKTKLPTAASIYLKDFSELITANKILVALDDADLGVSAEIGIVNGFNFVHKAISEILSSYNSSDAISKINEFLKKYPLKTMYGHLSDIRVNSATHYEGFYIPYGYNQFVIGAILNDGLIYDSYLQAIKYLVK